MTTRADVRPSSPPDQEVPDRRPALDGLRGLAVLAVIAYHLGLPLPGGFLGVDVFFVLSGYLITALLLAEHAATGRVRLGHFWARRARRLLPAALVVLLACAVVVRLTAPVVSLDARRADLLASLGYYANWHFIATDQSYFAAYTGASPLRHMWSLAIEEQFYVVWPLLLVGLLALVRGRRVLAAVVVGLGAAASVVAMASAYDVTAPSRAYLGTDGRAHELLIGAVLALVLRRASTTAARPCQLDVGRLATFFSGVLLVLASVGLQDTDGLYYTGGSLVVACSVAVLLWRVESLPAGSLARALGARPLAAVGRISYGLYLWHWPAIVWLADSPTAGEWTAWQRGVAAVALTVLGATLSYRLVEQPVRTGRAPWVRSSPRRLGLVVPLALALVAGTSVQATASPATGIARQVGDHSVRACPRGGPVWCVRVAAATPDAAVIATVGDSTSLALDPGLRAVARDRGWGYVQAGRNGCSFLPLPLGAVGPQAEHCRDDALALLDAVKSQASPDVWLVSDGFLAGRLHTSEPAPPLGDPARDAAVVRTMVNTLRRLIAGGGHVVLLEAPPSGEAVDCALGERHASCGASGHVLGEPGTAAHNGLLRQVAAALPGAVTFLPVADLVCTGRRGRCTAAAGEDLVRYDGVHYTAGFSRRLVPAIVDRMLRAGVRLS